MRALRAFAVVAALAVVCAPVSSARHRPPVHPVTVPRVSGAVPYVAPWQTGFEKFATQVYPWPGTGSFLLSITVPGGQWWRVIFAFTRLNTDATGGVRLPEYEVLIGTTGGIFKQGSPVSVTASMGIDMTIGPGLTSYGTLTDPADGAIVFGVPDVMWPPGSRIMLALGGHQAGDQYSGTPTLGVEIYTEDRPGVLAPFPTPQLA